ncbi:MAG: hypothetical protein P8163_05015 [Candidatus Thiodiazotropha sp.]
MLWPEDRQRLNVAINLLPTCLSADLALPKKLSQTGKLRILVLHDNQEKAALSVSSELLALESIAGHGLDVAILSTSDRQSPFQSPIAALFIVTPGIESEILNNWVEYHQTTVFPPS